MTLESFFRKAITVRKFVTGFPILAKPLSFFTGTAFPPMGESITYWRFVAVLVIGLAGAAVYPCVTRANQKLLIKMFFSFFVVAALAYISVSGLFVEPLRLASGASVFVIVGEKRPDLPIEFAGLDPAPLIKAYGFTDARLEACYTRKSLLRNRMFV